MGVADKALESEDGTGDSTACAYASYVSRVNRVAKPFPLGYAVSTRRRRNRTYQATGYAALPVLKTGSATRPVPPQRQSKL